jgi:hypothetical protein
MQLRKIQLTVSFRADILFLDDPVVVNVVKVIILLNVKGRSIILLGGTFIFFNGGHKLLHSYRS